MFLNRLSLLTGSVLKRLDRTARCRRRSRATRSFHTAAEVFEARQFPSAVSLGVIDGNTFKLDSNRATDTTAAANATEIDFAYGFAGDTVLIGNWNGQGSTPVVVRQPGVNGAPNDGLMHWYFDTNGDANVASHRTFGLAGDSPVVGDWNGDGKDDIGVTRKAGGPGVANDGLLNWFLSSGTTPLDFTQRKYGFSSDTPVVGNWDGVGGDDLGVLRVDSRNFVNWLQDWTGDLYPERTFIFGLKGDQAVVGDWDGDGKDNAGVARTNIGTPLTWYLDTNNDPVPEITRILNASGTKAVVGDWRFAEIAVEGVTSGQLQSVNIGVAKVGQAVSRTFAVQNTGTSDLVLGTPTVPAGFVMSEGLNPILRPGERDTFTIQFSPTEARVSSGLVTISTNDRNERTFEFSIHGSTSVLETREDMIGVVHDSKEYRLDTNGDRAADIRFEYGQAGDTHLVGDWWQDGPAVVRNGSDGLLHWLYDTDGDRDSELEYRFGLLGDTPLLMNWDGQGGDNMVVVRPGSDRLLHWYMDSNGDPNAEREFRFGFPGDMPVTGDWNGDGIDDVGVVRLGGEGLLHWYLNTDEDPYLEVDIPFGVQGDKPVVGDWDGDGRDNVGVVRSGSRDGLLHWYLDTNGEPTPERELVFGSPGDVPIVGQWEMPDVSLSGEIGGIIQQFNRGRQTLALSASSIADAAWDKDIADIPLLRDQPADALQFGEILRQVLGGNSIGNSSVSEVIADFNRKGFRVDYLSTTPNSRGNYLEVTQLISSAARNVSTTLRNDEGFAYLENNKGRMTGTISGQVRDLKGSLTYIVDATGFHVSANSTVEATFDLRGKGSGNYQIGVLDDVSTSGDVSFTGKLGLRLRDTDGDGELTARELTRNDVVLGSLDGRVNYDGRFDTRLLSNVAVTWNGSFSAQIQNQSIRRNEQFAYPDYQNLARKLGASIAGEVRQFDWFQRFESLLTKKLPLIDKSPAELLHLETNPSALLAAIGFSPLNSGEARNAMQQLVYGKVVDLLRFDNNGSIKLWEENLIPPVHIEASWFGGLIGGEVNASLRANVSFVYQLHGAIDTRGLYFTSNTSAGIQGALVGEAEGKVQLVGRDVLTAKGTVTASATLGATLFDPSGRDHIYLSSLKQSPSNYVRGTFDIDLKGKLTVKLKEPFLGGTVATKSFSGEVNLVHFVLT